MSCKTFGTVKYQFRVANWSPKYEIVIENVDERGVCFLPLQLLQLGFVEQAQQLVVDELGMIGQLSIAVDVVSLIELLQLVEEDGFVGCQLAFLVLLMIRR